MNRDDAFIDEEIVSVNDQGRTDRSSAGKVAVIVVLLALALIAALYGLTNVGKDENSGVGGNDPTDENKTARVPNRRTFAASAPGAPAQPVRVEKTAPLPSAPASPIRRRLASADRSSRYGGGILTRGDDGVAGVGFQGNRYDADGEQQASGGHQRKDQMLSAMDRIVAAAGGTSQGSSFEGNNASDGTGEGRSGIHGMLETENVSAVRAMKLGDRNMIIAKGAQVDCTMSTKIVSQLAGFCSCIVESNVYSDNGKVVLIEKGSEATGSYGNSLSDGDNRIFVVWDRIKTPHGVIIKLDSPGTDPLGTSGLPGYVDSRWMKRIGGAFLLSVIKDAIGYYTAKESSGDSIGGQVYQNTSDSGKRISEIVLNESIKARPILYKNHGDPISIYVARDLDFGSVYTVGR
ncbi:MAG: type IV secretion system protein VirB10 [Pseudomonadales bacterium]